MIFEEYYINCRTANSKETPSFFQIPGIDISVIERYSEAHNQMSTTECHYN